MSFWDGFAKYCGIQGVCAIMLVAGYIIAPFVHTELPAHYGELMTLCLGYYFAKNGVGLLNVLKGNNQKGGK